MTEGLLCIAVGRFARYEKAWRRTRVLQNPGGLGLPRATVVGGLVGLGYQRMWKAMVSFAMPLGRRFGWNRTIDRVQVLSNSPVFGGVSHESVGCA